MLSFHSILALFGSGIIGLTLLIIFEISVYEYFQGFRKPNSLKTVSSHPLRYLVDSPSCRIPDWNPYDSSTWEYVRRVNHSECSALPPLTEVVHDPDTQETYLQINRSVIRHFTREDQVNCCVSFIHESHRSLQVSKCVYFSDRLTLHENLQQLIVICYREDGAKVYENLHVTVVGRRPHSRPTRGDRRLRRLNVLVVGLDSVSRLNLQRTMPRTVTYLHTHGWTELRGYTKVADNTLPNLMALLTGIAPGEVRNPHRRFFDGYPFIWKEFSAAGYVTALVEDHIEIGTFDCYLRGFRRKPTDYYPKSFFVVGENLKTSIDNRRCIGFQSFSAHVFSYLLDFARTHREDPFFGLFWVNDFSHNDLNQPSAEDDQVLEVFQKLESLGIMNTTMVVFISDHGLRVGRSRKTLLGWYEDRLPFAYVSVPEWFKSHDPQASWNLMNNAHKLTSPYDIYKTLSHVLHGQNLRDPLGCQTCHSLFAEVPESRTCSAAGVSPHWCACHDLIELPVTRSTTSYWANLVVRAINRKIDSYTDLELGFSCARLTLQRVLYFRKKKNSREYVVGIQTLPSGAEFEATIVKQGYLETVDDSISRINDYGVESHCARNPRFKLFCYCVDDGDYPQESASTFLDFFNLWRF